MFAHNTRSIRYMLAALLVAALPLTGCPEDENNKTTDMGSTTTEDQGTDQGSTTEDQGTQPVDMGSTTTEDQGTDQGSTTEDQGTDQGSTTEDQGTDQGGELVCDDGSKTCFLNGDCAASERCESEGGGNSVSNSGCCREGARGEATFGQECTGSNDCESGLCIGGDDGKSYCSKVCEASEDCAESPLAKCNAVYSVCIPEQ